MNWVLIVCGLGFVALGVSAAIAPRVSERRRRIVEATGAPWYGPGLIVISGSLWVLAGVTSSGWAVLAAVTAMVGSAIWSKRLMQSVDDPPPMIARQREQSLNPLRQIAHPVRTGREFVDLFRIRRNLREQRAWEERRGFRPKADS